MKLDKTAFKFNTFEEASNTVEFWRSRPVAERLKSAYELSLRAHGLDPKENHRLDKTYFRMRIHEKQYF